MSEMRRGVAIITATLAASVGLAVASLGSAPAATLGGGSAEPLTTGRAIVEVKTPRLPLLSAPRVRRSDALAASSELLDRVAARDGIDVAAQSAAGGFITAELNGRSVGQLRGRLAGDPLVTGVEPEYRAQFRYAPSDPALYMHDPNAPGDDFGQWNVLFTGAETAWNIAKGTGGEVAVIDSGTYVAHPDLSPHLSGSLNCAPTLPPVNTSNYCSGTDVTDTEGHGTHVAGLACAAADNRYGVASIGFGCSLYAIKTDLTYTSIIQAIYKAVAHGSDVINMSFGGGGPLASLQTALNYAWSNGVVLVAAGDNNPNPSASTNYPAQYIQPEGSGPNIDAGIGLVVTSASHSGLRSNFAQKTSGVSVAAYGSATDEASGGQQGILSTWPPPPVNLDTYGVRTTVNGDNRFAYLVGTSMAAPQVSGLVGLMRSAKQGLAAPRLVRLIKLTASNCGQYGNGVGWGTIRSDRALAAALGKDVNPPVSRVTSAKLAHVSRRGRVAVLRLKRADAGSNTPCTKDMPASGLRSVVVLASANGGPYHRIAKTMKDKLRFHAKRGRRYTFISIAVDKAGNREAAPGVADAKLRAKRR